MGVYRFSKKGDFIEPIGRFNNNTWGMGIGEDFEIFGSTANNNHCCYVGIPLRHYNYLNDTKKRPSWAINSDFIRSLPQNVISRVVVVIIISTNHHHTKVVPTAIFMVEKCGKCTVETTTDTKSSITICHVWVFS